MASKPKYKEEPKPPPQEILEAIAAGECVDLLALPPRERAWLAKASPQNVGWRAKQLTLLTPPATNRGVTNER